MNSQKPLQTITFGKSMPMPIHLRILLVILYLGGGFLIYAHHYANAALVLVFYGVLAGALMIFLMQVREILIPESILNSTTRQITSRDKTYDMNKITKAQLVSVTFSRGINVELILYADKKRKMSITLKSFGEHRLNPEELAYLSSCVDHFDLPATKDEEMNIRLNAQQQYVSKKTLQEVLNKYATESNGLRSTS